MPDRLQPRSLLALPWVYRLFVFLLGDRRRFVEEFVRPQPGMRLLDVGCGPGDVLAHLPEEVEYLGLDLSPAYIRAARQRFGRRGTFLCRSLDRTSAQELGHFDLVLASGLVHHLDDGQARELFRLAGRVLRPHGRLVTLDGCYTPQQSALARYFVSRDRGRYVRSVKGYQELARQVFGEVKTTLLHHYIRLPYTHIVMECSQPHRREGP